MCVVTGVSGALGRSFVQRCFKRFHLVGIHNNHEIDFATQNQIFVDPITLSASFEENAHPLFTIQADLSDEKAVNGVCAQVLERFRRVDVLINIAALRRWSQLLEPFALREAELMFSVNILAPLRLAIGFAEKFWSTRRDENIALDRHVLNISDTAGIYVYPDLGQCLYSASKAALNYATYHLASELWEIGIRVNALAPDTFPAIVPTERVVDEMVALDESHDTGRLVIVQA